MKRRKFISLLLILTMLGSMMSGCGTNQETGPVSSENVVSDFNSESDEMLQEENTEPIDEEVQKAIDLGFVPDTLQEDYGKQITYAEFSAILDNFISVVFPDKISEWKSVSESYREATDLMSRMEGALVFLYAAECVGADAFGYQYNIPLGDLIADNIEFYEGVTWDYPLLPDIHASYYNETLADSENMTRNYAWRCDMDYAENAVRFVEYFSFGNGKTYFDYDERYSLNLGDAFTLMDAICAVERLYETVRFFQYVSVDDVTCTVSEATIALAEAMPEASWKELPEWTGYTVPPGNWTNEFGTGMMYDQERIRILSAQGFNFIRVPLDFSMIFNGTNVNEVNPAYLETMDDLIEYCADAGIHVCFDLHDMPGFYTGGDDSQITLWKDESTQQMFADFWGFLAEYYKDIPSSLVSFNLLNEPHSMNDDLTDELYSAVMRKAIEAIHTITPDRLIFVDMLGVTLSDPVQGLVGEQIVQTVHPYFMEEKTQEWPCYIINGSIQKNSGVLTLKGDFPAGTEITANICSVHGISTFFWEANGTTLKSMELEADSIGENGCVSIGEEGTDGEFRNYNDLMFTVELTEDSGQIQLVQENGGWYQLESLTISTESYTITLYANGDIVPDDTVPVISVADTGEVSVQKEETLVLQSRGWLDSVFQSYHSFTEDTGMLIMVQEFEFPQTVDYQVTLAAADDFLSVLDDYDIPWCSWYDGTIIDRREYEWNLLFEWGESLVRADATYDQESENYMIDTGLMGVYQKHMQ